MHYICAGNKEAYTPGVYMNILKQRILTKL